MTTFRITSPDGTVYKVTGPPGATREQALAILQQRLGTQEDPLQQVAEETGALETAAIGAGKAFTDIGRGAQDLWYRMTGDDQALADLQAQQAEEERLYAPLAEARPFATGLGQAAPYMAAGGVTGALARGLGTAANIGAQAAAGGAVGGLGYAPTLDERVSNAMVEAALSGVGEAGARTIMGLIHPGVMPATGGKEAVTEAARAQGYRILPSSEFASDRLKNVIEGGLESTPGGAIEFDRIANLNNEVFNRQVASAIGETADEVTGPVLLRAEERIGGVFDDALSKDARVLLDDEFADELARIDADQIQPLMLSRDDPFRREFEKLEDAYFSGEVAGDVLHSMQSRLGKAARREFRKADPDVEKAFTLDAMRMALIRAAERSLPEKAAALQEARRQYRMLMNVRGTVDSVTGNVSAKKLANRLEKRDRKTFYDLESADPVYGGAAFMARVQDRPPTSGTAERSYIQNLISRAIMFGGGGAGAGAVTGGMDPESAAVLGIGSVVAPSVAARAYLSPIARRWLVSTPSATEQAVATALGQVLPRGLSM